jgi:hypothetical protein
MKRWLACWAAMMALAIAGCQSDKMTVLSLENGQDGARPVRQVVTAPEKGTYYLYSSIDPKTAVYHIDLKKGDEVGFSMSGSRAQGLAKGVLIELSDYSEGASYTWKVEPEKKKE